MSALRAAVLQALPGTPRPADADPARRGPVLRLVRAPRRAAPKLPFVAVVVVLLAAGLAGLLLLSLQRAQTSIAQHAVSDRVATLADQAQALQREVEDDSDPTVLAARAQALGMVPGTLAGFVGAGGKVLGAVPSGAPVPAAGSKASAGVVVAGVPIAPVAPVRAPTTHAPAAHPTTAHPTTHPTTVRATPTHAATRAPVVSHRAPTPTSTTGNR